MSRFSKSEAEARGWVFVHADEGQEVTISDPQHGNANLEARLPSYRAEKSFNGELINEHAESMGKLLERIHSWEKRQAQRAVKVVPAPIDPAVVPMKDDLPIRTVVGPDGVALTEAEWSSRDHVGDAILKGGKMVFHGAVPEAAEAAEKRLAIANDVENDRAALPEQGETEQVVFDTADRIDSPGQSAGGTVVVREGESLEDASKRRDAEKHQAESDRVNADREAANARKAAESGDPED